LRQQWEQQLSSCPCPGGSTLWNGLPAASRRRSLGALKIIHLLCNARWQHFRFAPKHHLSTMLALGLIVPKCVVRVGKGRVVRYDSTLGWFLALAADHVNRLNWYRWKPPPSVQCITAGTPLLGRSRNVATSSSSAPEGACITALRVCRPLPPWTWNLETKRIALPDSRIRPFARFVISSFAVFVHTNGCEGRAALGRVAAPPPDGESRHRLLRARNQLVQIARNLRVRDEEEQLHGDHPSSSWNAPISSVFKNNQ
jgi:hypothetical protein